MTRRRSAWIAGLTALLLAAGYLLARRRQSAVEPLAVVPPPAPQAPPEPPAPLRVETPPAPALVEMPTAAAPVAKSESSADDPPTAPLQAPTTRSWNTRRSGPARPPVDDAPAPVDAPTALLAAPQDALVTTPDPVASSPVPPTSQPDETSDRPAEHPLATWIRVAIIGAALLDFIAVSLIATKQV
jgi:hypothetical protein